MSDVKQKTDHGSFEWWKGQSSSDLAESRFWENNTDKIRSIADELCHSSFSYVSFVAEIYDAVHYLGLESFWWDWIREHFSALADVVAEKRRTSPPGWRHLDWVWRGAHPPLETERAIR